MKGRPSAEKRRKELQRLERQRDKADRRKLRRTERTLGTGAEDGEDAVVSDDGIVSADAVAATPPNGSLPAEEHVQVRHTAGGSQPNQSNGAAGADRSR